MSSYRTRRRKIHAAVEKAMADITEEWKAVDEVISVDPCSPSAIPDHGPPFEASSHLNKGISIQHKAMSTQRKRCEKLVLGKCSAVESETGVTFLENSQGASCDDLVQELDEYEYDYSDGESEDDLPSDADLASELSLWAIAHSVPMNALASLLQILRKRHAELPKDPRTLLKTARSSEVVPHVQHVSGGKYFHFGVATGIESELSSQGPDIVKEASEISLQINVDGVPVFKSTNGQFWPILGKIDKPFVNKPFIIGVYYGLSKPNNLEFLNDFVLECRQLQEKGIVYMGYVRSFKISALICDAPARAFMKNTKSHSAYSACERCVQSGAWQGKITFPENDAAKRTDVSFDEMEDTEHHRGLSPLSELHIGMVSQFVLDYMHLVCLGIVRRLIWLWLKGPVNRHCRLSAKCIADISDRMINLRQFIPVEFARKPRTLLEWQRWKATEFRQFLLYTGPVTLIGKLSDIAYQNFMMLYVGIFVLLRKSSTAADIDYADQLLALFVRQYSELYGSDMVVYNVHNVLHLADDARKYGSLDNISAFCFENFLGRMVKLVRTPNLPFEQLVRRILEKQQCKIKSNVSIIEPLHINVNDECHDREVPPGFGVCRQYKRITLDGICISVGIGNNCVCLGNDVAVVCNIVVKNSETLLLYKKFHERTDFFSYPLPSSQLGIYKVCNIGSEILIGKLSEFKYKNVMLPYGTSYVVAPLLHML